MRMRIFISNNNRVSEVIQIGFCAKCDKEHLMPPDWNGKSFLCKNCFAG